MRSEFSYKFFNKKINLCAWKCTHLHILRYKFKFLVLFRIDDKEMILKYFPKAQFSCFEDGGHEVCARYPDKFVEEASQFLEA